MKSINLNVVGSINANGIVLIATNKQYHPYNLPSRLNKHLAAINRYVNPNNKPVPAAKYSPCTTAIIFTTNDNTPVNTLNTAIDF